MDADAPRPAFDHSVWRRVGDPLVPGESIGPLVGSTVAVKDLFDIAGERVGAGVPAWLDASRPAEHTASAVSGLLAAGASVVGIARTDEFAYSIAGVNRHYGTPPNPASPAGIPGGSSSGPASAVATGAADIGLATDTAGSIRVPASYQGLWGIRTSHGRVKRDGLLPLAPSFDTVGWLTRDPGTLARVVMSQLEDEGRDEALDTATIVHDPALLALVEPETASSFRAALAVLARSGQRIQEASLPDPNATFETFRTVQQAEAWRQHGAWISEHPDALSPEALNRFALAARVDAAGEASAREVLEGLRSRIRTILDGRVLVLPTTPGPPPPLVSSAEDLERVRGATLRLTAMAGVAGAPAVSAPVLGHARAPVGLCVVASPTLDRALVRVATRLAETLAG
jgi:Asp-tRNA(Asn)/Glu-tRNA(Gln) amidotransferase A subunit family amidase